MLKIFGDHPLQAVAVKANQLAQEIDREEILLPRLVFFFDDNLGQNRARDVVAALGVIDIELRAFLDHKGQVLQRDIGAGRRIVQAAIGIFLDGNGLVLIAHDVIPA